MKTIGLIGGVSWTSTHEYYKRLNKGVYKKLGGYHSAKVLMHSFNFQEILQYQATNNVNAEADMLIKSARALEKAGADFILICSNTTNKTSLDVANSINVPLINLIEITAEKVYKENFKKVALLGTKYVMYGDFYKKYFDKYSIEIIIPEKKDGLRVHDIIYNELVKGIFQKTSSKFLVNLIEQLSLQGAEAAILGCTELPLVVDSSMTKIKLLDTIQIHVDKALELALE